MDTEVKEEVKEEIEVKEEVTEEKSTTEMDEEALDALLNSEDEVEGEVEQQQEEVKEEVKAEEEKEKEPEENELTPEEKAAKQLSDKEAFIQRQAAEIGELRKKEARLREELEAFDQAQNDELYQVNPTEAVNQVLAAREKEAEINRLNQQAAVKQSELLTKENVPDFEDYIEDMTEIMKTQKVDPEFIRGFKANPYHLPAPVIVNLALAAKLNKENKSLKAEIEKLKKRPDEVLKKVETAARQTITGSTGKAGKSSIDQKQVIQMSTKELDELLSSPDPD